MDKLWERHFKKQFLMFRIKEVWFSLFMVDIHHHQKQKLQSHLQQSPNHFTHYIQNMIVYWMNLLTKLHGIKLDNPLHIAMFKFVMLKCLLNILLKSLNLLTSLFWSLNLEEQFMHIKLLWKKEWVTQFRQYLEWSNFFMILVMMVQYIHHQLSLRLNQKEKEQMEHRAELLKVLSWCLLLLEPPFFDKITFHKYMESQYIKDFTRLMHCSPYMEKQWCHLCGKQVYNSLNHPKHHFFSWQPNMVFCLLELLRKLLNYIEQLKLWLFNLQLIWSEDQLMMVIILNLLE